MIKSQSSVAEAVELLRDLQEFGRSGSKEAFRKQLGEEFVRRSGAASLHEAVSVALGPLVPFCMSSRKRGASSPRARKRDR